MGSGSCIAHLTISWTLGRAHFVGCDLGEGRETGALRLIRALNDDNEASSDGGVRNDDAQQYIECLFSKHHLKETSAKRHVASLRSLFRWLENEGHISEDPFLVARISIRVPKRLPRVLSRPRGRGPSRSIPDDWRFHAARDAGRGSASGRRDRLGCRGYYDHGKGRPPAPRLPCRPRHSRLARGVHQRKRRAWTLWSSIPRQFTRRSSLAAIRSAAEQDLGEHVALTRRVTPATRWRLTSSKRASISATFSAFGAPKHRYDEIYTHVADAALKSRVIERHPRKAILRGS